MSAYETEDVLVVRYGEVALKGKNKPYFVKTLLRRINAFLPEGASAAASGGLLLVRGYMAESGETLFQGIRKLFGVSSISRAKRLLSRDLDVICTEAVSYMQAIIARTEQASANTSSIAENAPITFKVVGKRADKNYPITSPELAGKAGEAILRAFQGCVKVAMDSPQIRLYVHLRSGDTLIYDDSEKGAGGLPLGTNGKGMVLLSGGIDSPVAAYAMARRGMRIEAVHFHSYPYTSKRAEEKIKELAGILASYIGSFRVHILNLLPAQEVFAAECPESEMTILVRRMMLRAAERVARETACGFLVTGENLGQVASQTADALAVTDAAAGLPVLRPLIAFDKTEIIEKAQEIGTYETSIQPFEDCCTVFLPRHPATHPRLCDIEASEKALGEGRIEALLDEIFKTLEIYEV